MVVPQILCNSKCSDTEAAAAALLRHQLIVCTLGLAAGPSNYSPIQPPLGVCTRLKQLHSLC